jgi:hypothetical protein
MGLDSYLTKKTYVKRWEHHAPEDKHTITVRKGLYRGRNDVLEKGKPYTQVVC